MRNKDGCRVSALGLAVVSEGGGDGDIPLVNLRISEKTVPIDRNDLGYLAIQECAKNEHVTFCIFCGEADGFFVLAVFANPCDEVISAIEQAVIYGELDDEIITKNNPVYHRSVNRFETELLQG